MHVLKMLVNGNVNKVNRRQEQQRRGGIFNNRHNYYKNTRVTSVVQEEHSAFPAGVVNKYEDTDDENADAGGEKEIEMEMQQLRVVQHWINQSGWDHTSEHECLTVWCAVVPTDSNNAT